MATFPAGPRVALLQTLKLLRNPYQLYRTYFARYGDPFTLPTVFGKLVVTADPEGVREVLSADPDLFHPMSRDLIIPLTGPRALIIMSGEPHRRDRKLMMPPFHGARMRAYGQLMQESALRHSASWKPGQPITMQDTTQDISLDIIFRAVFGVQDRERLEQFRAGTRESVSAFSPAIIVFESLRRSFAGFGPWARFERIRARNLQLLNEEIDLRLQEGAGGDDILSLLLAARDESGAPFTRDELRDQLATLLFAGHETSALALAWAFYWLHREPACHARLMEELEPLGPRPDPDALAALPYLAAVCDETLRLHAVLPNIGRELKEPWTLRGYMLPAGTTLLIALAATHMNPSIYPEPERFRPERFLERHFTPFEYLPFGGGNRRCIGAAFALYEMRIVLGSILARHRFRLADERVSRPVRRNFTFGPDDGVRLIYEGLS